MWCGTQHAVSGTVREGSTRDGAEGRTDLQKTEHRVGRHHVVGVRGIPQVAQGPRLVAERLGARDRGRMAAREEVADVDGRALEGVLEPERVDDEHRVVEEELRSQDAVLADFLGLV